MLADLEIQSPLPPASVERSEIIAKVFRKLLALPGNRELPLWNVLPLFSLTSAGWEAACAAGWKSICADAKSVSQCFLRPVHRNLCTPEGWESGWEWFTRTLAYFSYRRISMEEEMEFVEVRRCHLLEKFITKYWITSPPAPSSDWLENRKDNIW